MMYLKKEVADYLEERGWTVTGTMGIEGSRNIAVTLIDRTGWQEIAVYQPEDFEKDEE